MQAAVDVCESLRTKVYSTSLFNDETEELLELREGNTLNAEYMYCIETNIRLSLICYTV
jgi:hypothetical protein